MPWSRALIADLGRTTLHPLFLLRTVAINNVPLGSFYAAASDPTVADGTMGIRGVQVKGSRVQVGSWSSTIGGFTVEIYGDFRKLKRSVTRGTFVELLIGFPGYSAADYEVIAYGQVAQMSGATSEGILLECRDLLSALRSRLTTTSAQLSIGYRMDGVSTTLAADYTAGDATIQLASATGFGAGIPSAARITPTTGDPFIVEYGGVSGNSLTSCGSGVHGTTAVDATLGDAVVPLLWVEAHPATAARYVIHTLSGLATSTWDALPAGDGIGLPSRMVDQDDCDDTAARTNKLAWQIVSDTPQADPLGWIQGWLARGALFLTVRQGLLTIREWDLSSTFTIGDAAEITDNDVLLGGWSWEAFDQDTPSESCNVTAYGPTSNASAGTEDPATLPAYDRAEYDLSDLVYSAETDQLQNVVGRTAECHRRVPERYIARCAGLRLAILCPGDRVRLYSSQISGRLAATYDGLNGIRAIVVGVDVDWGGCVVTVEALVYPTTDAEFP